MALWRRNHLLSTHCESVFLASCGFQGLRPDSTPEMCKLLALTCLTYLLFMPFSHSSFREIHRLDKLSLIQGEELKAGKGATMSPQHLLQYTREQARIFCKANLLPDPIVANLAINSNIRTLRIRGGGEHEEVDKIPVRSRLKKYTPCQSCS
jgi:hypothetical protein